MRLFFKIFLIIGVLPLFFSCGMEKKQAEESYGYVKLNLKEDLGVDISTKANDMIFAVSILNEQNVVVKSYNNHNDIVNDPVKLRVGRYIIKASTGENVNYGFDKPFYFGCDTVDVVANSVNTSNVVCSLNNTKVTVALEAAVAESFRECIVTVKSVSSSEGLIYSQANNTLDREGYFAYTGNDLEWSLYLVNNVGVVSNGDVCGIIKDVKPRQHYKLNFKISESNDDGAGNFIIEVDDEFNNKEHDFVINLNKKAKPAFTTTGGFTLGKSNIVSIGSTLNWVVNISSRAGVERVLLSHNSDYLAGLQIPKEFNLLDVPTKDAINSAGIVWSNLVLGSENVNVDFSSLVTSLPLGEYSFSLSVLDRQKQISKTDFGFRVIPSVETSTVGVEPWAKKAKFVAVWNTENKPSGIGFEYKKKSDVSWTKVVDNLQVSGSEYSIWVRNLDPSTEYVVRAVSDKEPSNEIEFTTEAANQIPNMTFDNWYKDGKHWVPNIEGGDVWWDASNKGANMISEVNPTSPESSIVAVAGDGKKAAKLETKSVFGVLAAGSIYLGQFGRTIGTSGAELYFGREYSCRPTSLVGYYSYAPVPIDKANGQYTNLKGQNDNCQIYVVLSDKPEWYTINTSEGRFIDFENDPYIIAYGEITDNTNTNGYKRFEIPLEYRNNRVPKYCILVCSSSKYGDFFTGGVGSILYVDEFEFTFD